MGLNQPPAYDYSPVNLTPSESTMEDSDIPILDRTGAEDRAWNLKIWKEERMEERKRMALKQGYIWAMTTTVGGTILGIVYIAARHG